MIAKRSIRRGGTGFRRLAQYIAGKGREIWTENCSDDLELALAHIEATQSLNTRTRSDKTYHLIVSFPEGERPGIKTLKDIERTLADRLGYTEHHRLAALHTDTRHLHLHVAISKIHPETLKAIEPFRDFQKLFDACRALEIKHSLKRLHEAESITSKHPMELHQGIQSFESWLKERLPQPMKNIMGGTGGWEDLHEAIARFDISLRKHGAGLVFSHRSAKLFCKASEIDRGFSLKRLEDRFGQFEPCTGQYPFEQSYKPLPLHSNSETKELFAVFALQRDQEKEKRSILMAKLRAEKEKKHEDILRHYHKVRIEVRLDPILAPSQKRRIYRTLFERMKQDLSNASESYAQDRKELFSATKIPRWREWLQQKAGDGDSKALLVLRSTAKNHLSSPNYVTLKEPTNQLLSEFPRSVSTDGIVIYKMPSGDLTDHGKHLCIQGDSSEHMTQALAFIVKKFGVHFQVSGSPEFKAIADSMLQNRKKIVRSKKDPSSDIGL